MDTIQPLLTCMVHQVFWTQNTDLVFPECRSCVSRMQSTYFVFSEYRSCGSYYKRGELAGGQFQLAKYACYQGTDIKTGQFHRDISRKFEVHGALGAIWSPMVDFSRTLHFGEYQIIHNFGHKRASHGSPRADIKWERSYTLHDAL